MYFSLTRCHDESDSNLDVSLPHKYVSFKPHNSEEEEQDWANLCFNTLTDREVVRRNAVIMSPRKRRKVWTQYAFPPFCDRASNPFFLHAAARSRRAALVAFERRRFIRRDPSPLYSTKSNAPCDLNVRAHDLFDIFALSLHGIKELIIKLKKQNSNHIVSRPTRNCRQQMVSRPRLSQTVPYTWTLPKEPSWYASVFDRILH